MTNEKKDGLVKLAFECFGPNTDRVNIGGAELVKPVEADGVQAREIFVSSGQKEVEKSTAVGAAMKMVASNAGQRENDI